MKINSKKLTTLSLLLCMAIIIGYLECLIPFDFGIPGIKLGLTNIVILMILELYESRYAYLISILRVIIVGMLFSNVSMMIYGLAGTILAITVMLLCKRSKKFSVMGISMAGAVAHNTGQLIIAFLTLQTKILLYYFPILLIVGLITGFLIGMVSNLLLPALKKIKQNY